MAGKGDKKIDFGVLKSMVQKVVKYRPPRESKEPDKVS